MTLIFGNIRANTVQNPVISSEKPRELSALKRKQRLLSVQNSVDDFTHIAA